MEEMKVKDLEKVSGGAAVERVIGEDDEYIYVMITEDEDEDAKGILDSRPWSNPHSKEYKGNLKIVKRKK